MESKRRREELWRQRAAKIKYTVSQKTANLFLSDRGQISPILIIFGRKNCKRLKLCEMHSFSTLSNSHHHTTMLNADVPNCYRTL